MRLFRGRWIANVMVGLIALVGVQWAAFAYPASPAAVESDAVPVLVTSTAPATAAYLMRGPHLAARQAKRLGAGETLPPLGPLGPHHITSKEHQHLVAGTALTIVSVALLVNFLWMVIVGSVWLFGHYLGAEEEDPFFPPQAALFPISFAFLVPGLILLPLGLKELKIYRAIESAEWGAPGGPPMAHGMQGMPLMRF